MKKHLLQWLALAIMGGVSEESFAQAKVQKTNSKPVYMHVMPWFDAPGTLGAGNWGWHWKMNTKNPNKIIDASTGKREIASHYYPQIGPYDSSDPFVIDYQLLLMKLAGVDGVLIDWYGTAGNVPDIPSLLSNSNAIINRTGQSGLNFGLVIEDRFSGGDVNIQRNSMKYIKDNYFTKSNYFKYGNDNANVVGIFGPIAIESPASWNTIFSGAGLADNEIEFLQLDGQSGDVGTHTDGQYAWPYQDAGRAHNVVTEGFYKNAKNLKTAMGIAYPGFHDYYVEGGAGGSYFYIPYNGTATLTQMFDLANQYKDDIDILQLSTWNDYGEGTIFEPTVEFGYSFLVKLQQYTGVSYNENDLKQVTRHYNLRKQYPNDQAIQSKLNQVYTYLANLQIAEASALMCTIDNASGCTVSPSVSIASSGSPAEGGATGSFMIKGLNLSGNITVPYTISGTASAADYKANPVLTGNVTLSAANSAITITITPVDDAIQESTETLILTLGTPAGYTITQGNAQLSMLDNEPVPCTAPIIAFTNMAPAIDQTIEALWDKAPAAAITKTSVGVMPAGFSASWKTMYDNTYLYLLVQVKDSKKFNDSGADWYQDDNIEIFFDGNNSKSNTYDGANDYQIAFRYNDAVVHAGSGNMNVSGITFAMQDKTDGYNLEARIPWSAIGTTAATGKSIGFEVAVDCDNDGNTRDAQVAAFSATGTAYQNPSVFGTVSLATCQDVTTDIIESGIIQLDPVLIPNPVKDGKAKITLPFTSKDSKVEIMDVFGTVVSRTTVPAAQHASDLNLSGLCKGVYILLVHLNDVITYQKFIIE